MPIRPENKARYPKDWALRSRFVRFVRGRGKCEWCEAEHGKPHPVTGSIVVLTCAHVYDHRPEAASLLNLAGLCQRCHNRHDAKMRANGKRSRENEDQLTFADFCSAFVQQIAEKSGLKAEDLLIPFPAKWRK